ncbi:transcriptional regulator, LysR family protein [Pseudooceanicola batsensis HTCC2597]|uniref:Transcriptional regulator, LysR family protein n=1 Tax=Pseudooceanicola batsensis (strain ATCC BAA-863 / DSM 15984 / KCTC 12145 / HTCC2597) TaxID=252305 RepID=A3TXJ9_PSEBH|nr:hydrogen peroxide-inducible genes activator [Pseudooceanicola batsensis]EAQ03559.1 transcriptional regulator, LysR family protein [Pseudooceanicola batsensis HTCC2597]
MFAYHAAMNLTLRQLAYFKALADHGNFGRAALAERVSQPALSMQIKALEETLGAPLVERNARRVVLTPFGRRILVHATRVLEELRDLEEAARWKDGLAGRLALGVIPTVAPYLLPGLLARLRAEDIALDVQVQEGKTARLLDELAAGRIDAAIMALPSGGGQMIERRLFDDRFLLAGSAARIGALGAEAETLRPTEIGASQLMLLEDGHCLTDQALDVCGRGRGHAQINTGASSLSTLSRLVAAGFGLTLLPEMAARTEARDLTLLRFAAPEPFRTIGLVRRATAPEAQWFDALAQIIVDLSADLRLPGQIGAAG